MARHSADTLTTYRAKRDFAKTKEPSGEIAKNRGNSFVVQKHDATRLHYDFRLELDGVLKSWAVTRGPSLDPEDKRLAVRTEDHPLGYGGFEGTIPKGQYGGGTVMLWDDGTWEPVEGKDPRKMLKEGHLHFTLQGHRMKGEWILVRMKPRPKEKNENWLLRKVEDSYSDTSEGLTATALTSITTGRSMADIANGKRRTGKTAGRKAGKAGKMPAFQPVQLATLVDHVPAGRNWLHEMKYDGYRCLLAIAGGKARTYTRTGQDWSDRFRSVVEAGQGLDVGSALIDGEIVVLDEEGRPSFQRLQAAIKGGGSTFVFQAFDLLMLDGEDLTDLPQIERKERLAPLIPPDNDVIEYSDHIQGNGDQLFNALCAKGFEGIVSKQADAPYQGRRTKSWLKIKCTRQQEFLIVGWTASDKGRGFRALLLGTRDEGKLRYAGKVGTGFDTETMIALAERLQKLERKSPTVEAPRSEVRGAHWVSPKLVAEIAFTEFTEDGRLRHPSYLGLREDKPPEDVALEEPKSLDEVVDEPLPIKISNADRVIFPESKTTKGDLADYYHQVAPLMLPWMARRPVSLVRCPQGRAKKCFFQKHDSGGFEEDVKHIGIREKDGSTEDYLYLENEKGILNCVQMGTIEFHGWGSTVYNLEKPDRLVFDLDPDVGLDFEAVKEAAAHLRVRLEEIGLASFPMLSGGKGVHVIVPLKPSAEWPEVKDFASRFARALASAEPDRFTAALPKAQRKGKIFIDWLRNQRGATAIMPYSARARESAPVAVPVSWSELPEIDSPAQWKVKDGAALSTRARSNALKGWGMSLQLLPQL